MTTNAQEITIRIICRNLPGRRSGGRTGVRLGIQKGKTVVDDVGAEASGVTFTADLRVVPDNETGRPNFLGPFAQGPPQGRFIYLCWGERRDDLWVGFRRAKLPLGHLGADVVDRALADGQPLTVVVDMTDAKGEPLCASIKPDQSAWQG